MTHLYIDAALILLAVLYLLVARCWWYEIKTTRQHRQDMLALEKTADRARQVREFAETRFWS
jgi:hypothetical protein